MSADNWTYCPKCQQDRSSKRDKAIAEANKKYGKVSLERFQELMAAAREHDDDDPEPTLREDYSQGMYEGGRYEVSYGCSCNVCGFHFEYKHEEKVL